MPEKMVNYWVRRKTMKKLIVIALCLVANFSFGYKIGPRSTDDGLAIATWRARDNELAEEKRVLEVEIGRIVGTLTYSKPNRIARNRLLRQLSAKKAKLRANINKRIAHLNRGRRLRIPDTMRTPGNPDWAMSSLQYELKRAR